MEAQISTSENYTDKAWHLIAALLSIGRPAYPAELAEKCSHFFASPELIEFLCFVPDSPLFLSKSGVVLLSSAAFRVIGEFLAVLVPEVQIEVVGSTARKYFLKRASFLSEVVAFLKERVIMRSIEGNDRGKDLEKNFGSSDRPIFDLNELPLDMPWGVTWQHLSENAATRLMAISNTGLLEYRSKKDEDEGNGSKLHESQVTVIHNNHDPILDITDVQGEGCGALFFQSLAEISAFLGVDEPDPVELMATMDTGASLCANLDQHDNTLAKVDAASHPHKDFIDRSVPEIRIKDMVEQPLNDYSFHKERADKEKHSLGSRGMGSFCENILCCRTIGSPIDIQPTSQENFLSNQALIPVAESECQNTLSKISAVPKDVPQLKPILEQKTPPMLRQNRKEDIFCEDTEGQKNQNTIAPRNNSKQIVRNSAAVKEKSANKDQNKSKYPEFESYAVEEEEGSGGYGTVYRARRKTDGVTFAIKYPHANAHVHHLKNELRMLRRFGGKNCVIKYEGSLKNGNVDCFVLEHVEHDRPEALKREIDIDQLQWYGFCLFMALSSLHKKGVFHRDVKPGNFLFSCKTSKGYLIDFNLAKDLHQQPGSFDHSQPGYISATEHSSARQHKFDSPTKRRKNLIGKPSEAYKVGTTSGTNHTLDRRTLKRKTVDKLKFYDDLGRRNSVISQAADGSGLTSKDMTSTRTSGERLREPIPCHGRKELISLAQQAMQSPSIGTGSAPLSKRKRVTASSVLMDQKFIYLSPTPLHSSGNCISGAGLWKNKAVKLPKEGPCVGTKGYRAPEVLLRSTFQGPKIDVWSAGVTLLYLITGKMPFTGDPEQNMKDIVKLKGNEDLWEVAKLHNRESSLPEELLDVRFLQSMSIKEWCLANTKRTKFLDAIPGSLFDLIEKCLTVNPRLRITSEEALRHEFFAPCHDTMQRIKMRRQSQNQQSSGNSLSLLLEPVRTPSRQVVPPVNY